MAVDTQTPAETPAPLRVLFACDENSVRSPMAEGLARHLFGNRISFGSVGVHAGDTNAFAVAIMDELGINMADHQPRDFESLGEDPCDLIISLTPRAQHHAIELTRHGDCEAEYWPTPDPTIAHGNRDTILESFRDVREMLSDRISKRFS